MTTRCDGCAFYNADPDPITGDCRRYAPRVTLLGDVDFCARGFFGDEEEDRSVEGSAEGTRLGEGSESGVGRAWPTVLRDDWCGEHRPRYVPRHPPAATTVDLEVAPPLAPHGCVAFQCRCALRIEDAEGVEHVLRPNAAGDILIPYRSTIVGFE